LAAVIVARATRVALVQGILVDQAAIAVAVAVVTPLDLLELRPVILERDAAADVDRLAVLVAVLVIGSCRDAEDVVAQQLDFVDGARSGLLAAVIDGAELGGVDFAGVVIEVEGEDNVVLPVHALDDAVAAIDQCDAGAGLGIAQVGLATLAQDRQVVADLAAAVGPEVDLEQVRHLVMPRAQPTQT